ncbi:hypothetical protein D3C86_2205960 [compost metagenome]
MSSANREATVMLRVLAFALRTKAGVASAAAPAPESFRRLRRSIIVMNKTPDLEDNGPGAKNGEGNEKG